MKIREIIQTLFPTRTWKLAAIIAGGVLCGLGSYTLYASRAWTYLSDDPATCVNCHIMGPYYATWNHSSHSRNATCNDCHVPHERREEVVLQGYGRNAPRLGIHDARGTASDTGDRRERGGNHE